MVRIPGLLIGLKAEFLMEMSQITFPSFCSRRQHYFSDLLNTLDAVVIGVTLLIAIAVMFYEKKFLRDVPMYETYCLPLKTTTFMFFELFASFDLLHFPWFYLLF